MVASDLGPMVNKTARINGRIIHFRGPPYVLLEAEQRASVLLQLLALAGLHRVQGGVLLPGPGVRDGQLEPDLGTWTLDTGHWTLDIPHSQPTTCNIHDLYSLPSDKHYRVSLIY